MTKRRTYYSLLEMQDGQWAIAFGDYERAVVRQELLDLKEGAGRKTRYMIVETMDDQASIDAAVAHYNAELPYA